MSPFLVFHSTTWWFTQLNHIFTPKYKARKLAHKKLLATETKKREEEVAVAILEAGVTETQGGGTSGSQSLCWDFVRTGGRCHRGVLCPFIHKMVPVTLLPMNMRFLIEEDNFPASRYLAPFTSLNKA